MCASKPKAPPVQVIEPPEPIAPPPAPQAAPQEQDASVQRSRGNERRRRLAAAIGNSTAVTGGAGLTAPANTTTKQLFGQ